MTDVDPFHLRLLEALLFASPEPLAERDLARYLPEGADLRRLLDELEEHYRRRGVTLVRVGNGWAFRTAVDLAPLLARERRVERKLSRAAAETLAIIAYHQPVTRAEIEEIRGVQLSRGTLDVLLAEGWIRPRGRRQTPGRPITWGTSQGFLDHFGLAGLDDLPNLGELRAAGLLDTRPAIQAYGIRAPAGEAAGDGAPEEEETD
jgi:segregation and condensation protein B